MRKIGFIGVGVMGKSMVRNLMKRGFEVAVYTRTKAKILDVLAEGARWCDSVAACAAGRDAVITIVGMPSDVEEVYFAPGGILESARAGCYLIDMTTTSPRQAERIAREAAPRGLHALDAPVSGGDGGARAGTLSIMVGGEEADYEACRPIFEAMGTTLNYEGPAGCGQHTKMANQIAIAGALGGVCEAVAYAERAGLDPNKLLASISAGAAGSWQMTNNGPKMVSGDDRPGFFIKHFLKDLGIAADEGERLDAVLPATRAMLDMCRQMAEDGRGEAGTQALVERYRKN